MLSNTGISILSSLLSFCYQHYYYNLMKRVVEVVSPELTQDDGESSFASESKTFSIEGVIGKLQL